MNDDYEHAKKVWKDFENQNLGECHNLHVYSNKLLLVDEFENFSNKCIVLYELDPVYLFSAL